MTQHSVLSTRNLCVGYGKHAVLGDITLQVAPGTFTVLIGANGSGKSTLLRTLSGVQKPLRGDITFGYDSLASLRRSKLARRLAMVFTDRSGGGGLTVRETVEIGRHPYTGLLGRLSADDRQMVDMALDAVGMSHMAARLLGTLSDGERQKCMIARALAQDTPLIILDEPTAFLDVAGRIEITALLRILADGGKAIVLSTHDISTAMEAADCVWIADREKATVESAPKETALAMDLPDRAFPSLHFDKATYTYHR